MDQRGAGARSRMRERPRGVAEGDCRRRTARRRAGTQPASHDELRARWSAGTARRGAVLLGMRGVARSSANAKPPCAREIGNRALIDVEPRSGEGTGANAVLSARIVRTRRAQIGARQPTPSHRADRLASHAAITTGPSRSETSAASMIA